VRELGGPSYSRSEVVDAYSLGVPEVILAHLVRRRVTDEEAERYYGRLSNANVAPYDGITHLYDSSQPADTTLARPEDALALVVG
jgi:hypothetical protein